MSERDGEKRVHRPGSGTGTQAPTRTSAPAKTDGNRTVGSKVQPRVCGCADKGMDHPGTGLVGGCHKLVGVLFQLGDVQPLVEVMAKEYAETVASNEAGAVDPEASHTYLNPAPIRAAQALVSSMVAIEFMLKIAGYDRFVDIALETMLRARLSPTIEVAKRHLPTLSVGNKA